MCTVWTALVGLGVPLRGGPRPWAAVAGGREQGGGGQRERVDLDGEQHAAGERVAEHPGSPEDAGDGGGRSRRRQLPSTAPPHKPRKEDGGLNRV